MWILVQYVPKYVGLLGRRAKLLFSKHMMGNKTRENLGKKVETFLRPIFYFQNQQRPKWSKQRNNRVSDPPNSAASTNQTKCMLHPISTPNSQSNHEIINLEHLSHQKNSSIILIKSIPRRQTPIHSYQVPIFTKMSRYISNRSRVRTRQECLE